MQYTTTYSRGSDLSWEEQANGWANYINSGQYTDEQSEALVNALMDAQQEEVNAALPEGVHWMPHLAEIQGPAEGDFICPWRDTHGRREWMGRFSDKVAERFEEIEARVLRQHPGQVSA